MLKNQGFNLLSVIENNDFDGWIDIVNNAGLSSEQWQGALVLLIEARWVRAVEYLLVHKSIHLFERELLGCGINALHLSIYGSLNDTILMIFANQKQMHLDAMGLSKEDWGALCNVDALIWYQWIKHSSAVVQINPKTGCAPFEWSKNSALWAWVGTLLWSKYNVNWSQWSGPRIQKKSQEQAIGLESSQINSGQMVAVGCAPSQRIGYVKNPNLIAFTNAVLGEGLADWLSDQLRWESKVKKVVLRGAIPVMEATSQLALKDKMLVQESIGAILKRANQSNIRAFHHQVELSLGMSLEAFQEMSLSNFFIPSHLAKLEENVEKYQHIRNLMHFWMTVSVLRARQKARQMFEQK